MLKQIGLEAFRIRMVNREEEKISTGFNCCITQLKWQNAKTVYSVLSI